MLSFPTPPSRISFPAPPFKVSLPAKPYSLSSPAKPYNLLAALFPVITLFLLFPVPSTAFEPVNVKFISWSAKVVVLIEVLLKLKFWIVPSWLEVSSAVYTELDKLAILFAIVVELSVELVGA